MKTLSPSEIENIARAAHEANRTWCNLLGDYTQPAWEYAPEWQKSSARNGVMSVLRGEHTPESSHESWLVEKQAAGWTYGAVKDEATKTHPCMVAYAQLPPEQQYKDVLFTMTVRNYIEALWRIPQQ